MVIKESKSPCEWERRTSFPPQLGQRKMLSDSVGKYQSFTV